MVKSEKKEVHANLRILASSAYFVLFSIILSKILGYVYRLVVARQFGAEAYGLFSLAIMVVGISVSLASLGLGEGLARFIPIYRGTNSPDKARFIFRKTLKITVFLSVILTVLLFVYSNFVATVFFKDPNLASFLRIFSLSIPFAVSGGIFLASLRAYEKVREYSFTLNVVQTVSRVLAILLLVYLGVQSSSISYSYLISIILVLLVSYYYCKSRIPDILFSSKLNKNKQKEITQSLVSYSLPLLITGIVYSLFFWIDSFTIAYLKSATEVGIYNSAVTIALLLLVIPEIFMQLFFPLISKENAKGNKKLISELSKQVTKWIFLINLPLLTLFILFPKEGIKILFGQEFTSAANSLRILSIGVIAYSISLVSYNLVNMSGKSRKTLMYMIIATIVNFILNFVLIPMEKIWFIENSSGINGAALATTISMFL
ncbi:MAG TPA: flippase, partial [Candidatus Nanoarchaeia archaeon]|nr:flippase [Candidatus Nanoarchaeia archaeon]